MRRCRLSNRIACRTPAEQNAQSPSKNRTQPMGNHSTVLSAPIGEDISAVWRTGTSPLLRLLSSEFKESRHPCRAAQRVRPVRQRSCLIPGRPTMPSNHRHLPVAKDFLAQFLRQGYRVLPRARIAQPPRGHLIPCFCLYRRRHAFLFNQQPDWSFPLMQSRV